MVNRDDGRHRRVSYAVLFWVRPRGSKPFLRARRVSRRGRRMWRTKAGPGGGGCRCHDLVAVLVFFDSPARQASKCVALSRKPCAADDGRIVVRPDGQPAAAPAFLISVIGLWNRYAGRSRTARVPHKIGHGINPDQEPIGRGREKLSWRRLRPLSGHGRFRAVGGKPLTQARRTPRRGLFTAVGPSLAPHWR